MFTPPVTGFTASSSSAEIPFCQMIFMAQIKCFGFNSVSITNGISISSNFAAVLRFGSVQRFHAISHLSEVFFTNGLLAIIFDD
jgi:hypothetical protein